MYMYVCMHMYMHVPGSSRRKSSGWTWYMYMYMCMYMYMHVPGSSRRKSSRWTLYTYMYMYMYMCMYMHVPGSSRRKSSGWTLVHVHVCVYAHVYACTWQQQAEELGVDFGREWREELVPE